MHQHLHNGVIGFVKGPGACSILGNNCDPVKAAQSTKISTTDTTEATPLELTALSSPNVTVLSDV
jgi:hypothetical protein